MSPRSLEDEDEANSKDDEGRCCPAVSPPRFMIPVPRRVVCSRTSSLPFFLSDLLRALSTSLLKAWYIGLIILGVLGE